MRRCLQACAFFAVRLSLEVSGTPADLDNYHGLRRLEIDLGLVQKHAGKIDPIGIMDSDLPDAAVEQNKNLSVETSPDLGKKPTAIPMLLSKDENRLSSETELDDQFFAMTQVAASVAFSSFRTSLFSASTVVVVCALGYFAMLRLPQEHAHTVKVLFLVLSFFVLNIAIGNLLKWMMLHGEICHGNSCQNYVFPLTTTVVHMFFSWALSFIYLSCVPQGEDKKEVKRLSLRQQVHKILPLAAAFATSIAAGNVALKFIYPSFVLMFASLCPMITVGFSVLLERKQYNWWTWFSMSIICGGLLLCCKMEANYNAIGVLFVVISIVTRALKSILQGMLLDGSEKMDAVTLLCYTAPWAGLLLEIAALCTEGLTPIWLLLPGASGSSTGIPLVLALLLISGLVACFLNLSTFLVTFYIGGVGLQVLGNVKNCLGIIVSVMIFHNGFVPTQGLGVSICLYGVWLWKRTGAVVKQA